MPSTARNRLVENKGDIDRLAHIHIAIAGKSAGRKYGVEPLNKSMIVLTCAAWEAYVEDLCEQAVAHLADNLPRPELLPEHVRHLIGKRLADESKTSKAAVWDAIGKGWKQVLRDNLVFVKENEWHANAFNTPKSWQVDILFNHCVGLERLSDSWNWYPTRAEKNRVRLNKFVALRGDIAHRLASGTTINKPTCEKFLDLVGRLADASDKAVNDHLRAITGNPLF